MPVARGTRSASIGELTRRIRGRIENLRKLRLIAGYLRVQSFDVTTQDGRAAERYRLAAWAAVSNVISRGLSVVLAILGIHLTTAYLGSSRFGVWATFASMTAMLSFLDLGVGNALVNRVAHAVARGDKQGLRRTVTGGVAFLGVIAVGIGSLISVVFLVLPWGRIFGLTDNAIAAEASTTAVLFSVIFGVNLFASGLLRILAGQQRSYEASLVSALGSAIACVALWVAANQHAGVPVLLAVTFGIQTLAGLIAGGLLAHRRLLNLRELRPAMAEEGQHLFRSGALFLLLQIGTMIGWGSDSFLLASLKGTEQVAAYAVAQRLFQFASQPFSILNAPLWAAYADAYARGETSFLRNTLSRSLCISFVGAVAVSALILVVGPALIPIWTRDAIVVPQLVLLLFAGVTILEVTGNAFGIYLNGCGIVRQQVWVVSAFCLVALPMKLFFGSTWGAAGLLASTIIAYTLVVVGLYAFVFRLQVLKPLRVTT